MDATRGIDEEAVPTLFEWAGGGPALLRLTTIFYEKYVPEDPLLGPLFANMAPDHPERVAAWLGEVFGGPRSYSEHFGGYDRMVSRHIGKTLREEQRARWVQLLCRAADDAGLPTDPEWRAAFVAYLEWGSRIARGELAAGRRATSAHAGAEVVVGLRRDARLKGVGSRRADNATERRAPRSRRAGQLRAAHQAALSRRRSSIDALCVRPLVARGGVRARRSDPRSRAGGDDAVRRSLAGGQGRRLRALDRLGKGCLKRATGEAVSGEPTIHRFPVAHEGAFVNAYLVDRRTACDRRSGWKEEGDDNR